jgi:hypothetical protein
LAKLASFRRSSSAPQPDETDETWAEGLRQNVEPIRHDVNKAIDFLFQALPAPPSTS